MRAVYFISLVFLLLKGNHAVHTGKHLNSVYYSFAQHIKKIPQVKGYGIGIDVEDDDEEGNNEFAKKYLTATCLTAPCSFLLNYIQSGFPIPGPLNRRLSYKYITHRTLRV